MKPPSKAIAAVCAAAAIAFSAGPARAGDAGPQSDVAAVRVGLSAQLGPTLKKAGVAADAVVDDVVVDGETAVAAWHAGDVRGLAILNRFASVWLVAESANTIPSERGFWTPLNRGTTIVFRCYDGVHPFGPASSDIVRGGSTTLAQLAATHIASVADSDRNGAELDRKDGKRLVRGEVIYADCYPTR